MKKLGLVTAFALCCMFTADAKAVDTAGKFGVGANASVSAQGVSGLGLNYWIGKLKVGLITGYSMTDHVDDASDETHIGVAIHGLYSVVPSNKANLNMGLRLNLRESDTADKNTVLMGLELPVEAEFWITENVTVTGHVGFSVDLSNDAMTVNLGGPGFSGGAGFNFYF